MSEAAHIQHSPFIRNHWWWRPGWRQGRSAYTFHVIFDESVVDRRDGLYDLVGVYQSAVASLSGLDLIPIEWLHMTVQGVGFTDEVSDSEIDAIVAAAAQRCSSLRPLDVTFGSATVADEGILIPASPVGPLQTLRAALRLSIADVWGPARVPEGESFVPHVTVAYSNSEESADPYIQAVERFSSQTATVTVRAVSLLVLDRDAHMYRWAQHTPLPLGAAQ